MSPATPSARRSSSAWPHAGPSCSAASRSMSPRWWRSWPTTRSPWHELQSTMTSIDAVLDHLRKAENETGARLFVEEVALGPGMWDQLPAPLRETFVTHAQTWLDEQTDPSWAVLDLDGLSACTVPVLLSRGSTSPPWFSTVLERLAAALPNTQRQTFEGAGHIPHITTPRSTRPSSPGSSGQQEPTNPRPAGDPPSARAVTVECAVPGRPASRGPPQVGFRLCPHARPPASDTEGSPRHVTASAPPRPPPSPPTAPPPAPVPRPTPAAGAPAGSAPCSRRAPCGRGRAGPRTPSGPPGRGRPPASAGPSARRAMRSSASTRPETAWTSTSSGARSPRPTRTRRARVVPSSAVRGRGRRRGLHVVDGHPRPGGAHPGLPGRQLPCRVRGQGAVGAGRPGRTAAPRTRGPCGRPAPSGRAW